MAEAVEREVIDGPNAEEPGVAEAPAARATPTAAPQPTPTPWAIAPKVAKKLPPGWDATVVATIPAPAPGADPPGGVAGPVDRTGSRWSYTGVLGRLKPNQVVVDPSGAGPVPLPQLGVAPLSGVLVDVPAERPAVVVKIDNVAPARPQTALNQADIVYEELVEGGFTRLAAVFHSSHPEAVGPVRSARSTDIGIVDSFNQPVFVFSGANGIFDRLIDKQPINNRGAEVASGYWRQSGRAAPHNLYASVASMGATADAPSLSPPPHFWYRSADESQPDTAVVASDIRLKYFDGRGSSVRYRWDSGTESWLRWQAGSAHLDSVGVQVGPKNVVVQFIDYIDAGLTDKFGEDLYEGVSVGTGPAMVFTDGSMVEATWHRASLKSVTTFTDTEGNPVRLTPGQTFVSLIAPDGVAWN